MATVDPKLVTRIRRMREAGSARDAAMARVDLVRAGRIQELLPDAFSDDLPRSVSANFIDTVARDVSELISPLPTLEFNDESFTTQSKKDFASKKTHIGMAYWFESRLAEQMTVGSDRFVTYGFLPFLAEPDFETKAPLIRVLDPRGCYYHTDLLGRVTSFVQVLRQRGDVLAEWFPEYADEILTRVDQMGIRRQDSGDSMVEVVRYFDKDRTLCYLPEKRDLILASVPQPLGKVPVVVAERPGNDGPRGQFDDAIDVQLARSWMARMGLNAANKAVNAPLALPEDVNEFSIGPDAVLRSQQPEKIKYVGHDISPVAFQLEPMLESELRMGTRYPEARSGDMQASIITGRGVQALQGTVDTQIKTAQNVLGPALAAVTSLCYQIDEVVFPNRTRTVRAVSAGNSISETYTPKKDIRGDYRVDVVYGVAAGLGVNQAVIMILQLLGGGLMSRSEAIRQLPLGMDAVKMEREVHVQQVRDGLMQGVTGLAQSAAVLFEQGGDPSSVLLKVAQMISAMGKGVAVEDAYLKAFPPPPPQPEQGPPGAPGAPGAGPGGGEGAPPGYSDTTGLPMGTAAPGQPPGGRPAMQDLLAGLTQSGQPNMAANMRRRIPAVS